jgi:bifunctional polynucleotide phosphatase/kinase
VLDGIVEMLTVNGRPFTLLEDSGFTRAFSPVLQACGLTLNVSSIKNHIHERFLAVVDQVKTSKNELVSLKLDCVTRLERSFIGINLQRVQDGEIKVFNLATTELLVRHTGDNLRKVILQSIAKFDIDSQNIYAITTDSGANLLKAVKLMSSNSENEGEFGGPENDDYDFIENPEIDSEDLLQRVETLNWRDNSIKSTFTISQFAHV